MAGVFSIVFRFSTTAYFDNEHLLEWIGQSSAVPSKKQHMGMQEQTLFRHVSGSIRFDCVWRADWCALLRDLTISASHTPAAFP